MSIPRCMREPQGPHVWGTRGREHNSPETDDVCAGCHCRYGDLPISEHIVDPSQQPTPKHWGRTT